MFKRNEKGQGALEYLLLIVAAMFVVAAVIFFMSSAGSTTQESGTSKLYENLCDTLDTNTADCTCYHGNNNAGYFQDTTTATTYCCTTNTNSFLRTKWGCT